MSSGATMTSMLGEWSSLAQFERGELGLSRAATSEDVHLECLVGLEAFVDVGGDFGGEQFVAGLGENACDVEGDVADAEDGDLLGLEGPGAGDVGVAVVPGDEVGGTVAAVEVDAGDVQCAVRVGSGGEDDGVVEATQVVEVDVGAVVDVAEQANLRLVEHLVQGGDDALDAWVVRGNAVANEPERGRHPLEEVDAHARSADIVVGLHERVGGVDACRSGTDDGDAEWTSLISHVQRATFFEGSADTPA